MMVAAGLASLLLAAAQIEDVERLNMRVKTLERRVEELHSQFAVGLPVAHAVPIADALPGGRRLFAEATPVPTIEMLGDGSRVSFGQLGAPGAVLLAHAEPYVLALNGSLNVTSNVVVNGISFAQLAQTCSRVC